MENRNGSGWILAALVVLVRAVPGIASAQNNLYVRSDCTDLDGGFAAVAQIGPTHTRYFCTTAAQNSVIFEVLTKATVWFIANISSPGTTDSGQFFVESCTAPPDSACGGRIGEVLTGDMTTWATQRGKLFDIPRGYYRIVNSTTCGGDECRVEIAGGAE